MLKIGVISDTHIPINSPGVSAEIKKHFRSVDLILHAGDLIDLSVIEDLKAFSPVAAVSGNMDSLTAKSSLPAKQVVKAGKYKIGLIHNPGNIKKKSEILHNFFPNDKLDILVYGHTHMPRCEIYKKTIFFNPGSATDSVFAPYKSIGLIYLNSKIKTRIVKLEP